MGAPSLSPCDRAGPVRGPRRPEVSYRGATLEHVPTRHPRHAVTETPRIRAALDRLRSRGIDFTIGDLVVRGAEVRLAEQAGETARRVLRERLAAALRDGTHGLDAAALDDARERGWTRGA